MAPLVALVGIAGVVPVIAPCAGCPVARHNDENPPAVWLAMLALSMMMRSAVGSPSAAAIVSTLTAMTTSIQNLDRPPRLRDADRAVGELDRYHPLGRHLAEARGCAHAVGSDADLGDRHAEDALR